MTQDKVMHMAMGAGIVALVWTFMHGICGIPLVPTLVCGWLLADASAIGKECYDAAHPQSHTRDWLDAMATRAGGSLAAVVVYVGSMLLA